MTFVALGNGAPDLSANIAAISAGEVVLSAGAFTGAAMFVQVTWGCGPASAGRVAHTKSKGFLPLPVMLCQPSSSAAACSNWRAVPYISHAQHHMPSDWPGWFLVRTCCTGRVPDCFCHNCCWLLLVLVQCVVAAELIALAGDHGIKCGGAMLRDVGVYCLAIFSVLLAFALGKVRGTRLLGSA